MLILARPTQLRNYPVGYSGKTYIETRLFLDSFAMRGMRFGRRKPLRTRRSLRAYRPVHTREGLLRGAVGVTR